jgi:hypothetical protein
MKTTVFLTCSLMVCVSALARAQSDTPVPDGQPPAGQQSSAETAFATLKALAGTWKGQAAMGSGSEMNNAPVRESLRVTSGGSALMDEMVPEGRSDDPARGDDDPITMLYVDRGRLTLIMYCDGGLNRPRMTGQISPDGKRVKFDFLDVSGGTRRGYMHDAVFTIIDADHHTEDWTYMTPGNKPTHAHITFVRAGWDK